MTHPKQVKNRDATMLIRVHLEWQEVKDCNISLRLYKNSTTWTFVGKEVGQSEDLRLINCGFSID